jgi:hypothetical protein
MIGRALPVSLELLFPLDVGAFYLLYKQDTENVLEYLPLPLNPSVYC